MIFYFSATGNSKYVALKIVAGTEEEIIDIADCVKNWRFTFAIRDKEKIGFVTPTYFWGVPSIVYEFLEKLKLWIPDSYEPYIYHVATFGTTTGQVGRMVNELLKKRGLYLNSRFSVRMPDTWTPVFDLTDKKKIEKINHEAEKQIEEVVGKIKREIDGDFSHRKMPMLAVKLLYPQYEKKRQTKYFTVDDSCISCELCAKKCPIAAIEIQNGRPVWVKEKCTLCLGCLHRCPKFSIQYGNKTKNHGQYVNPNVTI
ncbi:MAG: EFR1 family ferrodoxin [Clostridium sp.]|jgi:ferredoxin|uniref:EFR1 family ferrodoxin n=1 Tax=Clostridium sp. TaxID=1506 RepID=UPI0025BE57BE|nr:EFR1 family ferrodoxin [Clostridium sp.]MCH3963397.1 EFR1 family ferrodoxin [Clostridium sp.]MCI1716735.1 EFR1 family ferrodoxin [Clostridium sp.]MCI1801081.1 EFR1 family ferrodoxin [Clostridium sp.]MCI1814921.1 EFR1 family ferrodoxin [Clostridium sp.]MCI1871822.1 EFR1 family ferrodoxin [Clostridium sp.]